MDLVVPHPEPCAIARVVERLAAAGVRAQVMMVDDQLVAPGAQVSDGWRDVRLRTPAGTLSLKRRGAEIAVVVFGNADAALQAMQRAVAHAIEES
jgi:hypothetical protein